MAQGVNIACAWLNEPQRLAERAEQAIAFAAEHRGAAQRMAERIVVLMKKHRSP